MKGSVDVPPECVAVGEWIDREKEQTVDVGDSLQRSDDDIAAGAEPAERGALDVFVLVHESARGDEVVGHRGQRRFQAISSTFASSAVVETE